MSKLLVDPRKQVRKSFDVPDQAKQMEVSKNSSHLNSNGSTEHFTKANILF